MNTQTLILLSVGFITVATMIYVILRDDSEGNKNKTEKDHDEVVFIDEDDSSNYATVDDGAEESIFESD